MQPSTRTLIISLIITLRINYACDPTRTARSNLVDLVVQQLQEGLEEENVEIPSDVPNCKHNLMKWISMAVSHFNENEKDRIAHCWCSIKVLEAWEESVQDKAMNDERSPRSRRRSR